MVLNNEENDPQIDKSLLSVSLESSDGNKNLFESSLQTIRSQQIINNMHGSSGFGFIDVKQSGNRTINNFENMDSMKEINQNFDENKIITQINSSINANELMKPIFENIKSNKQRYNEMKFSNYKKEQKISQILKNIKDIEQNEDMRKYRENIKELEKKLCEEKENFKEVEFEKVKLLHMIDVRKHDLNIIKMPVIEQLSIMPGLSTKINEEMMNIESRTKILNQQYVIF